MTDTVTITVTPEGGLYLAEFLVTVHDVIDGGTAAVRTFLGDVCDDVFGVEREIAVVGFQLAQ